jgi:type IV secretory pathway VirJ component
VRALTALLLVTACLVVDPRAVAAQAIDRWHVPGFGQVTVYRGPSPPHHVVLFLSGDGGWNLGVVDMAQRLRDAGGLVVGIDIRAFMKTLEASERCAYPAGALEELSRAVQLRERLPAYQRPVLVGYSSGATLAYAALAAAPAETFAGAISLGFCRDIEIHKPLCPSRGLLATRRETGVGYDLRPFAGSTVPWMVLQGEVDQVCRPAATQQFVAQTGSARLFSLRQVGHGFGVPSRWASRFLEALRAITDANTVPATPRLGADAVADLSLVEVPGRSDADPHRDEFAVLISGDGGWAELDKAVASGLANAGVPVVGWSSLEYYWTPRTPERAAADLARVIEHYSQTWHRGRVRIIGYSFGADVVPFLVNRLPGDVQSRVAGVTLLSPSPSATFEFHLGDWLKTRADLRYPTAIEIGRVPVPLTCVYATDEENSVCRSTLARQRVATVGHGHHFSGDYDRLVQLALR